MQANHVASLSGRQRVQVDRCERQPKAQPRKLVTFMDR